ncbi:hypothetical protein HHX47_DHR2000971 [Lentinula edodes]|nr:hypothetical protein HHX47_DHR2000971 [Lentinula edodes]
MPPLGLHMQSLAVICLLEINACLPPSLNNYTLCSWTATSPTVVRSYPIRTLVLSRYAFYIVCSTSPTTLSSHHYSPNRASCLFAPAAHHSHSDTSNTSSLSLPLTMRSRPSRRMTTFAVLALHAGSWTWTSPSPNSRATTACLTFRISTVTVLTLSSKPLSSPQKLNYNPILTPGQNSLYSEIA